MALPYYLPSTSIPFGTGVPTTSVQQINQIYQQHNIHTMAFLQGMQYPPPHAGFNFTPIPFKPYYTAPINSFLKPQNGMESLPFSHTVPKMIYTPVPLRPMPFTVSTQSYQFQLRQVAKRVAASDARVNAESKRHKPSEANKRNLNIKGNESPFEKSRPIDLVVIQNDDEPADSKKQIPFSGSRMNPLFVGPNAAGNDLSLNPDLTYRQHFLSKPGPGQQYITKIRALVEGIPPDDKKLIPSAKNPTKEKKVRQKSKTKENPPSKKKSKHAAAAAAETESKVIPSNWHPDPESYANDHLVIGSNGTFISKSFYDRIPWKSYNKSTRILIGHYFNNYTLATQSIDGDNPLNANIVEDIINHVAAKCNVGSDSVRDIISSICADEASRRRRT